ncbi:MAG TPA: hypothetical protein VMI56_17525 [Reyranella sp.]|nr:hypothetical protein [Reyranella sp.]
MIRLLFGLLGGLGGAVIGVALFAMGGAQVFALIWGAAAAGGKIGAGLGFFAGLFGGTWAVLRDNGRHAGHVVAFLWVGVVILAGCLAFVAFS